LEKEASCPLDQKVCGRKSKQEGCRVDSGEEAKIARPRGLSELGSVSLFGGQGLPNGWNLFNRKSKRKRVSWGETIRKKVCLEST